MAAVSHHPIGSLVEADRKKAAETINECLDRHGGNIGPTAQELGVHRATLARWIARLRRARHRIRTAERGGWNRGKRPKTEGRKKDVAMRA